MSSKTNKQKNKPAVGSPAAGSNNKEAKLKPKAKKEQPKKSPENKKADKNHGKAFEQFCKKYDILKIIIAAVAVAAVVCVAVIVSVNLFSVQLSLPDAAVNAEYKGRLEPDNVAVSAVVSPQQQEQLAKALRGVKGKRRAFNFYVNKEIIIDEYDDPALIEFGSVSSNDCDLVFFILDENDNIIYRSLGIKPGCEVRSVSFFDEVAYGTHKAKIVVNGYDQKTNKKLGTQVVDIKIKIGVDSLEK